MLIETEKIEKAKEKIGAARTAEITAELLQLEKFDGRNLKACCPFHNEDTPSFVLNPKTMRWHCFQGDTGVITKYGTFRIKELVGKEVEILNGNGEWETVVFHNCGEQEIVRLRLQSNGKTKEILTTKEHQWLINRSSKKRTTMRLQQGQYLMSRAPKFDTTLRPSAEGARHGFIFGDGYKEAELLDGTNAFRARVCTPQKLEFCKNYFDRILPNPPSELGKGWAHGVVTLKSNRNLKEIPDIHEPAEYLFGFIAGYFVADGNCSDDSVIFSSANKDDLLKVRDICTRLGIASYAIGETTRTPASNMGAVHLQKESTIYTLRLAKGSIPEAFFISSKKITKNYGMPYLRYKVVSVEETGMVETVYCCETSTHSFTLEDFILTGNCFGCGRNADLLDVYMHTGATYMGAVKELFKEARMEFSFGELGIKTRREYRYPRADDCGHREMVDAYMAQRGISSKTLDHAGITQDDKGNIVFNYYDTNDVLCMCKYRPSHKIDKSRGEAKNWCQQGADTLPLLFNMHKVNTNVPLLLTEGESDALAAIESGYTNAVSVPFGSQNFQWIEHNWEWLEQFDSIIICADNDEAGVKMRKEVVPRLGSWRTRYVEIPHTYINPDTGKEVSIKDLNEVLYYMGKEAVINLINNASDPGVPSVVNISEIQDVDLDEMDGIDTGIRELDSEIMRLFYGTLTVVSGLPGAGKTSFLSQLVCQSLEQGKPAWMFSREMPGWMEKSWLNYIMAGAHHVKTYEDRNGAKFYKVTPDAKQQINEHYSNKWFLYRDDWSNKLDDLLGSMEDSVRKYGAKLLILDNLMTIDLGSNENSELLKQTECINKLIRFAMKYSVAVVLVAHPRKMPRGEEVGIYDISGTSNIINLAHRTIGLRRIDKEREQSNHDVCLTLIKDRMRGKAGKRINMYYDVPTRRFYTNKAEYEHQYEWDGGQYPPLPYPHLEESEVYGEC